MTDITGKLYDAFAPGVVQRLTEAQARFSEPDTWRVVLDEDRELAEIYTLNIPVELPVTSHELWIMAETLTPYATSEETAVVDGREFLIGDGDDTLAIQFDGRQFRIWIRHFKYEV